jgi:hypothetical protein
MNLIMDTGLKSLVEVANAILQRFNLVDQFTIQEWIYFHSEGLFRTEGNVMGTGDHRIHIGKIHRPDHYILLDTSIDQTSPSDQLRPRQEDQPFFQGTVTLKNQCGTTRVATIMDKGQYPWGEWDDVHCTSLQRICQSLEINQFSDVRNCCAYTHIMYAIVNSGTMKAQDMMRSMGMDPPRMDPPDADPPDADSDADSSDGSYHDQSPNDQDQQDPREPLTPIIIDQSPNDQDHGQFQDRKDDNKDPTPFSDVSTLYQEYDYPKSLDPKSDWFPFDSKADAIIYMWDSPGKSSRLPQARLTLLLQSLPLIGVTGLTSQNAQKFRLKYDARIPLMKMHSVTAVKHIRWSRKHKRKRKQSNNSGDDSESGDDLKVKVPFFCPDEYIIRTMADPIWSQTLRFGLDKLPSSQAISQFNQTPYAAEILRWSQLQSFDRFDNSGNPSPITVGHWYSLNHTINGHQKRRIVLLQRLFYKGGIIDRAKKESKTWWPTLHAKVILIITLIIL